MSTLKHEELLQKLFQNVNDWLKFAEAKNLGLLTLNAAIVFGFTQITFSKDSAIETAGFCIFLPLVLFSFLACLLSLFPILAKFEKDATAKSWINKVSQWIDNERQFENIHYYGYLKNLEENEFESKFLAKTNSTDRFLDYEKELSTQILYNSRITSLKFQLFKIGAFLFLVALTVSVLSLPIITFIIK
jgi:hypothetical protein